MVACDIGELDPDLFYVAQGLKCLCSDVFQCTHMQERFKRLQLCEVREYPMMLVDISLNCDTLLNSACGGLCSLRRVTKSANTPIWLLVKEEAKFCGQRTAALDIACPAPNILCDLRQLFKLSSSVTLWAKWGWYLPCTGVKKVNSCFESTLKTIYEVCFVRTEQWWWVLSLFSKQESALNSSCHFLPHN